MINLILTVFFLVWTLDTYANFHSILHVRYEQ